MLVSCNNCGKEFDRPVQQVNQSIKRGHKLYCSKECRSKAHKIKCFCANCNKEIYKIPAEYKRSKTGNLFCSKSCACSYNNSHFRTKESNPNWKGGKAGSNSYTILAYRTYIRECAICGCSDPDMLEVHHIDNKHTNNNIDNLIILCANHHTKLHRGKLSITQDIKNNRKLSNSV